MQVYCLSRPGATPPQRRFPDFSYITDSGRTLTEHLDCVIIRSDHTHLTTAFVSQLLSLKDQ